GVFGTFAQPIPAKRDSTLHLEEQRARRLAARRAQDDVRDRVAVGYALEGTDRLLEIEGSLVADGRMRGSGDVVPRDGGQRRLRSARRLQRGCRELDRVGDGVGGELLQDRVFGEGFQLLLFRRWVPRPDRGERRRWLCRPHPRLGSGGCRSRAGRNDAVVDLVERVLVDQLRRAFERLLRALRLLAPALLGDHAEIESAHLAGGLVVQAEQLEDAELRSDDGHTGSPDFVREWIKSADVDLAS